ncbi:MAG: serine hydrolase domain-containing protein [Acidimicrobiales bacterium]
MTIDPKKVDALLARAKREVDDGHLPSVQVALAYEGELVCNEVFGDAAADTRYCLYSATKPFVSSVIWTLLAEGKIDLDARVVDYFPEFGEGGDEAKKDITVEHILLHQGGFPYAPMGPGVWEDRQRRIERMRSWKLNWAPGTRYEYHPTSTHWVQAELITRLTGKDYRDVVEERITGPAGLPRILGIPKDEQGNCAEVTLVGEHATSEEVMAVFGVPKLAATEVNDDTIIQFNDPTVREVGVPGGGGFGRAADLALFYQELLHNPHGIWDPAVLADATGHVRNTLPDPMGVPANRALGVIVAGDDGKANLRGHGRTVSPRAFGHNGAGGQLAWADPETGISLGYTTNGYDVHEIRQPRRSTAISSLAGACAQEG